MTTPSPKKVKKVCHLQHLSLSRYAFNCRIQVQRQKVLEEYGYIDDYYLCSVDGAGAFSSHQIYCSSCCVKEHKDGSKNYYHQLLAAAIVHPEKKEVIPLCPEAILKQDGENKNDCDRNATKRLLEDTAILVLP